MVGCKNPSLAEGVGPDLRVRGFHRRIFPFHLDNLRLCTNMRPSSSGISQCDPSLGKIYLIKSYFFSQGAGHKAAALGVKLIFNHHRSRSKRTSAD
jgi:hypothetical protein